MHVRLGNDDGAFQSVASYEIGGNGSAAVAAQDLNSDWNVELVVTSSSSESVYIFLGNGDGKFWNPNIKPGSSPLHFEVGDLNGDGFHDFVVGNDTQGVNVVLGLGDGTFAPPLKFSVMGHVSKVAVGDFNGDGMQDVAGVTDGASDPPFQPTVHILIGNGDGTLQPSVDYDVTPRVSNLAVGDFNNDSKQDLVLISNINWTNNLLVLMGNGDGTFAPPSAPGDSNDSVAVLRGSGTGLFRRPVTYTSGINPTSLGYSDFNVDGITDLVLANGETGDATILIGLVQAHFRRPRVTVSTPRSGLSRQVISITTAFTMSSASGTTMNSERRRYFSATAMARFPSGRSTATDYPSMSR